MLPCYRSMWTHVTKSVNESVDVEAEAYQIFSWESTITLARIIGSLLHRLDATSRVCLQR